MSIVRNPTSRGGWRPSYPETSGYIATTFFRLARDRDPSFLERAQRILRWLASIQNADGSFCNPRYGRDGIFTIASRKDRFINNRFEQVRFAVHYMYTNDSEVSGNVSVGNHVSVGC